MHSDLKSYLQGQARQQAEPTGERRIPLLEPIDLSQLRDISTFRRAPQQRARVPRLFITRRAERDSGDDGHELDEDVEARARGVFEWVAYGVADYRSRVSRGAFAAEVAAFYVFLPLSHAPPELDMNMAIMTPVTMEPPRSPPSAGAPSASPTMTGTRTAMRPGTIISLRAATVEDVYAAFVFGTAGAFHYAGDFSELAADFFYHFLSCAAYCLYRKGAEEEGGGVLR